jgi:hypothetical protein
MDKFLEQLKNASKTIALPPERKRLIKFSLTEHMDRYPAGPAQPRTELASFLRRPLAMTVVILIVLLAGGAGTALASQSAIPGDPLYSFKVNVAERLETAFAFSTEQQAETELLLNERRLTEASQLLTDEKLNAETGAVLQKQLQTHENKLRHILDRLEEEEKNELAANVSARYEAILRAHQQLAASVQADQLATIRIQGGVEDNSKTQLTETITEDLKNAQSMRTRFEQKSIDQDEGTGKQHAAEGKINAAATIVINARTFVDSARNVTAESKANALAQITTAEETLAKARAQYEAADYKAAFISASQALRIAQSARSTVVFKSKANTRAEVKNDAEFFLHHDGEVKGTSIDNSGNSNAGSSESNGDSGGFPIRLPFSR